MNPVTFFALFSASINGLALAKTTRINKINCNKANFKVIITEIRISYQLQFHFRQTWSKSVRLCNVHGFWTDRQTDFMSGNNEKYKDSPRLTFSTVYQISIWAKVISLCLLAAREMCETNWFLKRGFSNTTRCARVLCRALRLSVKLFGSYLEGIKPCWCCCLVKIIHLIIREWELINPE